MKKNTMDMDSQHMALNMLENNMPEGFANHIRNSTIYVIKEFAKNRGKKDRRSQEILNWIEHLKTSTRTLFFSFNSDLKTDQEKQNAWNKFYKECEEEVKEKTTARKK